MSGDTGQERLNMKMLALLIGGSLGATVMSWIAYSTMVGRAL
jgi:homoserine acetyltransferase